MDEYHDHETGLHYNRHRYYDPGNRTIHSKCGSGYNLDGSIHDKGKGGVTFSKKTIDWLNSYGWSIPSK
jgi:hypothetical protein